MKRNRNYPNPDPTSEAAFRALLRGCGLIKRVMEPYFAAFEITGGQWGVLRTLARDEEAAGRGLNLSEVSRRLLIRPPSVTSVVNRLERRGLVARSASAGDQRAKRLTLTPAGRKLVARMRESHRGRIAACMSILDLAERGTLQSLLERLAQHLQSMTGGEASQPEPPATVMRENERRS